MEQNQKEKLRVLFPFVEAGLGHIMPMKAVADVFELKYGNECEVVRIKFFQDTNNPDLKYVEDELVQEVKLHNKHKWRGIVQGAALKMFGGRISMKYLFEKRYKRGFVPALNYIQQLKPDIIFNTHMSTAHYACEARSRGLIDSRILTYCTDPVIGYQWDSRSDAIIVSSEYGQNLAKKSFRFRNTNILDVPFLIRSNVTDFGSHREFYKRELGLDEDRFTILLADGAYGAGKLRATVLELIKTKQELNIIAVCGKNETLYREFCALDVPSNICFKPYGFTDKMLLLSAACDLFIGKAGSSNLAEPIYFGAPAIVTFCATFIEKWICSHQVNNHCAVKEFNIKKAAELACRWADNPHEMQPYVDACKLHKRCDGPEILADMIYTYLSRQALKTHSKTQFANEQNLQQLIQPPIISR